MYIWLRARRTFTSGLYQPSSAYCLKKSWVWPRTAYYMPEWWTAAWNIPVMRWLFSRIWYVTRTGNRNILYEAVIHLFRCCFSRKAGRVRNCRIFPVILMSFKQCSNVKKLLRGCIWRCIWRCKIYNEKTKCGNWGCIWGCIFNGFSACFYTPYGMIFFIFRLFYVD